MTAVRRTFALGLALSLVGGAAAADTVITADEVIYCWWVEPTGTDSIRFTLPGMQQRILSVDDIYEIRLPDSSRAAKLAAQLPGVRVLLDSGQSIQPPAVRARDVKRTRLIRTTVETKEGPTFIRFCGLVCGVSPPLGANVRLAKTEVVLGPVRAGVSVVDGYWGGAVFFPVHVGIGLLSIPCRIAFLWNWAPDISLEAEGGFIGTEDGRPMAKVSLNADADFFGVGLGLEGGWVSVGWRDWISFCSVGWDMFPPYRMSEYYLGLHVRLFACGFRL